MLPSLFTSSILSWFLLRSHVEYITPRNVFGLVGCYNKAWQDAAVIVDINSLVFS